MKTVIFEGHEIEYSPTAVHGWSVQRRIARGGSDGFDAVDTILGGKADEVADLIGGTVEDMARLMEAIADAEGTNAKN